MHSSIFPSQLWTCCSTGPSTELDGRVHFLHHEKSII